MSLESQFSEMFSTLMHLKVRIIEIFITLFFKIKKFCKEEFIFKNHRF